jgi:hypothetical protein
MPNAVTTDLSLVKTAGPRFVSLALSAGTQRKLVASRGDDVLLSRDS